MKKIRTYDDATGREKIEAAENATGGTPQALSSSATIALDASLGRNAAVTLSQVGHALAFSNAAAGARGLLRVQQEAILGLKTITSATVAGGSVKAAGGLAGLLASISSVAGTVDLLGWYYDGTDIFLWKEGLAFS